jgi:hypothetical protein
MLRLVTIVGRVMLGASGLLLTGCAYREYRDDGGYYRPAGHSYYERTDYRYGGERHYDRDSYRHRERYNDRYGRCD